MFVIGRPRVNLGLFPTPLQSAPRLSVAAGHSQIYVKRDDLSGLGLGGNKTRSLEFLLGDALSKNADVVITAGGLQSNLCALTAAACCKIGLPCILVHNDERPLTLVGNMLLNGLFGAAEHFIGRVAEEERADYMESLADSLRSESRRPYIIHSGASTPIGALGYVAAAQEIYQQSQKLACSIRHVAMVGAMGGTASGFVFGSAMLGHPFHVHVISVEYSREELQARICELCSGIEEATGLKPPIPVESVMTIHERFLGGGYAVPTLESHSALLKAARLEGVVLENVYTSKTLAGLLGLVSDGTIPSNEPCCYVHTGGAGSLFAQSLPI